MQDVEILDDLIGKFDGNMGRALREYTAVRKKDADAIQDLAFHNYIEMRDHVSHSSYKFRKSLDHILHSTLGERWIPLYSMVSFRSIPYSQVIIKAERQDRIVKRIELAGTFALLIGAFYFLAKSFANVEEKNNN